MKKYPSDLTDNQWQVIKDLIENGRKRKHELREIMNGILVHYKIRLPMTDATKGVCTLTNHLFLFQARETEWAFRGNP